MVFWTSTLLACFPLFSFGESRASRRLSKLGDGFVRPFGGKGVLAFPGQTRRAGFKAGFWGEWRGERGEGRGERVGRGKSGGKRERNDANLGDSPLALCRAAGRGAPDARKTGLLSLSIVGRLNLGIQSPRPGARSARAWVLHALRPGLKKRVGAGSRQGADGRRNGEKSGRGWPVGRLAGWSDARPARLPFAVLTRQSPCVFASDIA